MIFLPIDSKKKKKKKGLTPPTLLHAYNERRSLFLAKMVTTGGILEAGYKGESW